MKVAMKNPKTGKIKEVKIGWSWVLFLFSGVFGLPLFLRELNVFGGIFLIFLILGQNAVHCGTVTVVILFFIFLGLHIYVGIKGNEMTVKNYLENGWVFVEPDSEITKMAKMRWGILLDSGKRQQERPLFNLPTAITFSRILLIPLFVLVAGRNPLLGAVIFAIASVTDLLDGYIARRSNQVTKFGVILDPIADKLLVISALIIFVDMGLVPTWIAIVIIAREFTVTVLRIVALSKDIVIPAEAGGKIKMTAQIIFVLALLVDKAHFIGMDDLYCTGTAFLWGAMLIGIFSGVQYFILFGKRL